MKISMGTKVIAYMFAAMAGSGVAALIQLHQEQSKPAQGMTTEQLDGAYAARAKSLQAEYEAASHINDSLTKELVKQAASGQYNSKTRSEYISITQERDSLENALIRDSLNAHIQAHIQEALQYTNERN